MTNLTETINAADIGWKAGQVSPLDLAANVERRRPSNYNHFTDPLDRYELTDGDDTTIGTLEGTIYAARVEWKATITVNGETFEGESSTGKMALAVAIWNASMGEDHCGNSNA